MSNSEKQRAYRERLRPRLRFADACAERMELLRKIEELQEELFHVETDCEYWFGVLTGQIVGVDDETEANES